MRNRIACVFFGLVFLLAVSSCSNKPLCPAYTDAEPLVIETPDVNS